MQSKLFIYLWMKLMIVIGMIVHWQKYLLRFISLYHTTYSSSSSSDFPMSFRYKDIWCIYRILLLQNIQSTLTKQSVFTKISHRKDLKIFCALMSKNCRKISKYRKLDQNACWWKSYLLHHLYQMKIFLSQNRSILHVTIHLC